MNPGVTMRRFPACNAIHRALSGALLLTSGLLFLSCGGPPVSQSAIDGRVNSISNWTVTWEQDKQPADTAVTIKGLNEQSRYTLPDYCRAYVENVAELLRSEHEISVYRNMAPEGRIQLRLFGLKSYSVGGDQRSDAERLTDELVSGEYDLETDNYRSVSINLPGSSDIIRRVEVSLYGFNDLFLGKIIVGDTSHKKVKPSHVAEAVAKALRTGRVDQSAQ